MPKPIEEVIRVVVIIGDEDVFAGVGYPTPAPLGFHLQFDNDL